MNDDTKGTDGESVGSKTGTETGDRAVDCPTGYMKGYGRCVLRSD